MVGWSIARTHHHEVASLRAFVSGNWDGGNPKEEAACVTTNILS